MMGTWRYSTLLGFVLALGCGSGNEVPGDGESPEVSGVVDDRETASGAEGPASPLGDTPTLATDDPSSTESADTEGDDAVGALGSNEPLGIDEPSAEANALPISAAEPAAEDGSEAGFADGEAVAADDGSELPGLDGSESASANEGEATPADGESADAFEAEATPVDGESADAFEAEALPELFPGTGTCCPTGDCLCHGDPPLSLSSRRGPFLTATVRMAAGTAHYPTTAEPPFAGIAICPGFLNSGPEMTAWGTFYASWGIVTVVTNTFPTDFPNIRGLKLLAAIDELKDLNNNPLSPLGGKMANRYGTSGYSMGGGGTTIASGLDRSLKTSVGLAAWGPNGLGVTVPTLLICGGIDAIAPCNASQSAYNLIPGLTPKMLVSVPLSGHLAWFGPNNTSGGYALAFQKVYLEGDDRWKRLLTTRPLLGIYTTNIL